MSGQDYEIVLCCLFLLRSLRITTDFFLTCNNPLAGKFDDVVLFYRLQGDAACKYRAIFLQAKHKHKYREKKLTLSNPFRLKDYLESFKKVNHLWGQPVYVPRQLIELQEITLVLYTTTGCVIGKDAVDVTDFSEVQHLQDFLNTGGRLLRISAPQRVGMPQGSETSVFIRNLLLCTSQMSVTTADRFLEEELSKMLGLTSLTVTKELVSELKRQVKAWWSEEESGRCLTADSEEWLKVLHKQIALLNSDILNTDRLWKLDFNQSALETLNVYHQRSKNVWIHVTDKYQATVTKVRLFRALRNPLVVGVISHQHRLGEVEALWRTSICPTMILDMTDGSPDEDFPTMLHLQLEVNSDVGRHLIVISNEKPVNEGWYKVKAAATWTVLHPANKRRLLSIPVNLQGTTVALRHVVGSPVPHAMSGEVIISLSECENGVKLGQMTPRPLDYYVPRCLQRTTSRPIRFDALQNTETFISSRTNSSIENELTNRFQTLSITDVHTIHKIEGPTLIEGLNSDSDIRKVCITSHVCGISGETTSDGFEGNVTEFIPFPWLCEEKVLIVEGCPGVGKSSFVTAMCWEVKKQFPEAWVLRMDMGRHTNYIKKKDFKYFSNITEFLLKDVQGLELVLLEHSLYVTGNVFLFLDAFDEICPDFSINCCELLKGIVKTVRFRKMVVTTRPVATRIIQEALQTKAFTLPLLSKEEQIFLLERLSMTSGRNPVDGEIASLCQSAVPVLEIPLLCKMAAEALLYSDHRHLLKNQNPWRRVLLYKRFVQQGVKYRITEKCELGDASPTLKVILADIQRMQFQKLQQFAVKKLMPTIQLSTVYYPPEEKLGLVVNSGETVDFEHQTFAEYFLGCWLAGHWQEHPQQIRDFLLKGDCEFVAATLSWSLFQGFPLHMAVAKGDANAVRSLLSSGATTADRGGRTVLHVAAMTRGEHRQVWELLVSGSNDLLKKKDNVLGSTAAKYAELAENWEFLDLLLEKGATLSNVKLLSDQNSCQEIVLKIVKRDLKNLCQYILRRHRLFHKVDDEGNTLVHVTAAHNSTRVLQVLVEMRHDVNERNKTENTPLHEASRQGHLDAVKTLIENRADTNMRNKGSETALMVAAAQGHLEVVKLLIENGVDTGRRTVRDETALILAAAHGHLQVVKLLIENGCNPNVRTKRGDTAITLAVTHCHLEVLNLLIQNVGDPNINNSYGESPMTVAARQGNLGVLEMLIQNGLDPNVKDFNGDTPLTLAARQGHKGVVKMLIGNGVDPNMKTETEETVLTLAARQGHTDMVKLLIELNIDLSVTTDSGNTALTEAAREGHVEVSRVLIQCGADPNLKNKRFETALMLASGHGRLEVVKMLTENGAVQTLDCDMALTRATIGGHNEVVKVLINNGAVPNIKTKGGYTVLMQAARQGHQEVIETFLQKGVDTNIKNKDGETALSLAAAGNRVDVVKMLIDNGACLNIKTKDGCTVLMRAFRQGHLDVVKVLLDNGAVPDIETEAGYALLMQAVCRGHREMIKLLIESGADPNMKAESGCPVMIQAVRQGDLEIIEILTGNGADPNVPDFYEETALMKAALKGHLEIVETLIQKGADPNGKNCLGETALILAARRGHLDVVRMLIENGADMNTKNCLGETAVVVARHRGHGKVVKLLIVNGADTKVKTKDEGTELMDADLQLHLEKVNTLIRMRDGPDKNGIREFQSRMEETFTGCPIGGSNGACVLQ